MGWGTGFTRAYVAAEQQDNDFLSNVHCRGMCIPERDEDWFALKRQKICLVRQIAQELECEFNSSGETVVHPDDLKFIESNLEEPKHKTGFDQKFVDLGRVPARNLLTF